MKTLSLKFTLLLISISILSGCYTQLSEPVSREDYYTEPDTVYQYQESELSEYNQGYRDGTRDFMNDYLWYGYNPDSYFYLDYRPYWNSPWSYHHSYYLGVYDPFFYDPFWDWGYDAYYSPYGYYGYNNWYYNPYSRYYYGHGYYRHYPYYYSGFGGNGRVSEGREQLSAKRQPVTGSASASQANRISISNNSGFQNTLNLPMAAGSGKTSTASGSSQPGTQSLPDGIVKPHSSSNEIRALDTRHTKSLDKDVPGFQTTLIPPVRPEIKPIKTRSNSKTGTKKTITVPVKKRTSGSKLLPSSKSSSSTSSETKSISKPKSRSSSSSGRSSKSSYSAPSKSSSGRSSSSRSSSVRSSSGSRSSGSSSSRSSSSRSSSSKSSSSKSSSKKSR